MQNAPQYCETNLSHVHFIEIWYKVLSANNRIWTYNNSKNHTSKFDIRHGISVEVIVGCRIAERTKN